MSEPKRQDYASDDDFIDAMAKHYGIDPRMCHKFSDADNLRAENARLKEQVERLTKAGDAMEITLLADFNGCPYEPTIVREAMIYWHAAKQGGQPSSEKSPSFIEDLGNGIEKHDLKFRVPKDKQGGQP